ncbi:MAG: monofunctional biosynthetic peptidoglycan transglycosylase [Chthoniobacter sp.]|nr:monofunctional biosynthetic peptidoglycan transglycosylase [Chthoniobacter sp.]
MKRGKSAAAPRRRWWLWLGVLILVLLLLPILQVACVRFINPPLTPLMLLRPLEARFGGQPVAARRYVWRPIGQIPRDFVRFVLVGEDQRFFRHHGFDWREIRLARAQAEREGREVRGASTISMQCARSLFLWQGRSWVRKGLEAYYTFWMELLLPKRRILELYVNVIEMGDGVYGLEAAAQAHYGVSSRALTRDQCAMLAALLPAPRSWDPRAPSPRLSARCAKLMRQEKQVAFPELGGR